MNPAGAEVEWPPHPANSRVTRTNARSSRRIALPLPLPMPSATRFACCMVSPQHRCYDFRNLGASAACGYGGGMHRLRGSVHLNTYRKCSEVRMLKWSGFSLLHSDFLFLTRGGTLL